MTEGVCPISQTKLSDLRHAVTFSDDHRVVYDAEHLVHWLRAYKPCNPITNAAINPRRRLVDLLSPHRLPHTTKAEIHATVRFLKQQGTVDGQTAYRDHLGICMCLVTWTSAGYGLTATYGCAQELMLYAREPEFACKTIPILLITTQLCCALGLCCILPEIRLFVTPSIAFTSATTGLIIGWLAMTRLLTL